MTHCAVVVFVALSLLFLTHFVAAQSVVTKVCGALAMFSGWPKEACASTCEACIEQGGVFCDNGRFTTSNPLFVSSNSTSDGVCWPGNLLGPTDTEQDFALVKITFQCDDVGNLPRFKQCNVPGYVPFLVAAILVGVALSVCISVCVCCTRRRRQHSRY
jgi:ABC-type Fe3+-siderophore transport system permease subunit